jgi:hypothetical protein
MLFFVVPLKELLNELCVRSTGHQRQLEDKAGAVIYAVIKAQIAAHGAAEAAAKRQPEADTRSGVSGFVSGFAEGPKKAAGGGRGDSLAMIAHAKHDAFVILKGFEMDDAFALASAFSMN